MYELKKLILIERRKVMDRIQEQEMLLSQTASKEAMKILKIREGDCLKILETFGKLVVEVSDEENAKLIAAKNLLIRHEIERMVQKTGRFDLPQNPFEKTCNRCHGTGELYKFFRTPKAVECKFCEGEGHTEETCKLCNGTGRFVRNIMDLKINVNCKVCHGTGKRKIRCLRCRGTGKYLVLVIDPKIKSSDPCPTCEGLGFVKSSTPTLSNPVISPEVAEKLKQ